MVKWSAALAALCAFGAEAVASEASEKAFADVKARLEADCADELLSGVVEAQVKGQRVFQHVCGFVDRDRKVAMTSDRTFKLLSISKPVTGTAVMILAEEGKIDFDAPIGRYVEGIPAAWDAVTVRHLLNHVSAIPDLTDALLDAYLEKSARSHAEALSLTLKDTAETDLALAGKPGGTWAYNNFGYELLAQAVAGASDKPFDQFVQERIFEPAGMKTALVEQARVADGKVAPALAEPGLALGYNGAKGAFEPALSYNFVQVGAGAVHASAEDLFALNAVLASGKILSRAMQDRSTAEAYRVNERGAYGFGWLTRRVGDRAYLQHSGGTNGYLNEYARTPDGDVAVVILSNIGGDYPVHEIRMKLVEALLQ
jgi:D-alanyl-D-alanine carboxypeptidase